MYPADISEGRKSSMPEEIKRASKMPCCRKMCRRTLINKEDILKCCKTCRFLPEEERFSTQR